jgi:hypothetical protein
MVLSKLRLRQNFGVGVASFKGLAPVQYYGTEIINRLFNKR